MALEAKQLCPVSGAGLRRLVRFQNGRSVFGCAGCGLRRLLPLPSPDELAALYGREEYHSRDLAALHGDLVAGYDDRLPIIKVYQEHLAAIAASRPAPARLLEIGCARGVFLDLARRAGYETAGIEMNAAAAAYAREKFGLAVASGAFEEAGGELGSFDIIAAFDVLEHAPDPALFLERLAAHLRPGGLAVIGTPDASSFLYRLAEALARWSGGSLRRPLFRFYGRGREHLTVFTPANLARLAAGSGLAPLRHYGYGIPLRNMNDIGPLERLALGVLLRRPYEFVLLARKKLDETSAKS